MPADTIAGGYAELIARERWQWFATLTFRPDHLRASGGIHPEKADKAFRFFLRCLNEKLYGKRWQRVPHGGVVWARGQELHKNGKPHFHAVLAAPDLDLNASAQRYAWHEFWYREFGRNQIEQPRNQEEVAGYVSKYVAKEGEVDFSHNFGAVAIPALPWPVCDEGSRAVKPSPEMTRIGRIQGEPRKARHLPSLSLTHPLRLKYRVQDSQLENDLQEPDL